MGIVWSYFSRSSDRYNPLELQRELDKLNAEIVELEKVDKATVARYRWLLKRTVLFFGLMETLVFLFWYFLAAPINPSEPFYIRFWAQLALVALPALGWLMTRLFAAYYNRRIGRQRARIQDLKEAGAQFIDDHLKAIDFQRTAAVLNKYAQRFTDEDPPSLPGSRTASGKKKAAPSGKKGGAGGARTSTPASSTGAAKMRAAGLKSPQSVYSSPAAELVEEEAEAEHVVEERKASSRRSPASDSLRQRKQASSDERQVSTPAALSSSDVSPNTPLPTGTTPVPPPAPQGSSIPRMPVPSARGTPQRLYRPPQKRPTAWWDKAIDWLIGDGLNYGIAMLCERCREHNGLSPPEEVIDFRCRKCGHHNSRPAATSSATSAIAEENKKSK